LVEQENTAKQNPEPIKPAATPAPATAAAQERSRHGDSRDFMPRSREQSRFGKDRSQESNDGIEEIVIKISRVTKVVKGGKRMSFSALVAVGDRHGNVGYGKGNANEVPFAVEKAVKNAKKNMMNVPMKETTLPHRTLGKFGATNVIIRPACPGTGIIAGSAVRAILELVGIKDVLAKVLGSTNPTNVVKATINALSNIKSYQERKLLLRKD